MNPDLKRAIFDLVIQYHKSARPEDQFIPGESRIPFAGRIYDEHELLNLIDASLDFWLTHGKYGDQFERDFAKFLNVKYCSLVNSGSSANLLAFMTLTSDTLGERKISRGDEIISVAAGFPTTVAPIIQFGAVPVFVDVELKSYNIDTTLINEALSPRTKAVFLAHTMGHPFEIKTIQDFCHEHSLWLIEDNCDALGSKYDGQFTGTFGDIGTSSFYPAHHITTGEGGAVYTNHRQLANILRSLRDWGRDCSCPSGKDNTCGHRFEKQFGTLPFGYDHKYVYSHLGYNLKATDLQAAIGCAQLDKLPNFVEKRRQNHATLLKLLADLEEYFFLPSAADNCEPSWFGFVMSVKPGCPFTRKDVTEFLENRNIQTRTLFAGNLLRHPCFDSLRGNDQSFRISSSLTNTDFVLNNTFWFGVYPGLTDIQLNYIAESLRACVLEYK